MNKEQLDALFAMQKAFPQEHHWVDENGWLHYRIPLTHQEHEFWKGAVRLMEPA